MAHQFFIALVVFVDRPGVKCFRIRNVDHNRDSQLATFCPDGINARIVDRYDFPALIFYRKPERLENLDAANAHAHSLLQTSSFFLAKVRFIDPTEIRRKEYKDPIAGNLSGYLQMLFVEIVFRSTIKTHAHPYA